MLQEYPKEQLQKIVDSLPPGLKNAVFSSDTADNINNICSKYGIEDNRVSIIAQCTGRVLMGIILPKDFQLTIEKETNLDERTSEGISKEISNLVFFPVKDAISGLHGAKTEASREVEPQEEIQDVEEAVLPPRNFTEKNGPDSYRESVE